uniref:Uncharacterized protein n=1 Tax=Acrobeloides nanus TaxID=290746 RepID=A0A914D7N9_9BILA
MNRGTCLSPASRIRIAADIHRYSTSDDDSGCVMDEYTWIPSGVKPDTIHTYFSSLPEDKVPYVNSPGEKWRLKQLQQQLPPQDSDARYCGNLNQTEENELNLFEAARKRECLGRGVIKSLPYDNRKRYCHQCKTPISAEDLVITAPERFGDRTFWHPKCFVCVECQELLVDLIYFRHNDNVFCGRHHAEQIKPRCAHCDELIFSEECTEAEGRVWHMKHFICARCDTQLGGQRYIVRDELAYCIPCYHQATQLVCNTCKKEIIPDKPHITQGETHWHADERCFCCSVCEKNLLGKRYSFVNTRLYCGVDSCARQHYHRMVSSSANSSSPQSIASSSNSSPAHSIVSRQSHLNQEIPKSPSRVRFDLRPQTQVTQVTKNGDIAEKRRPKPPPRHPPPPPASTTVTPPENIYETVAMPSSSSASPEPYDNHGEVRARRARRRMHRPPIPELSIEDDYESTSLSSRDSAPSQHLNMETPRRSRSVDARPPIPREVLVVSPDDFEALKIAQKKGAVILNTKMQNFYSRMPPDSCGQRQRSCSSSSSDSDAEDIYLSHYLASSLNRQEPNQTSKKSNRKSQRRRLPILTTPKTAKNKSSNNGNCIVS